MNERNIRTVRMCCTTCPNGCALTVQADGDRVLSVEGNTCKRGITFAEQELVCPKRMLTSTVLQITENGRAQKGNTEHLIPVRTAAPVPREKMMAIMQEIRELRIQEPVRTGDVLIRNAAGTGIDVIACRTFA